MTKSNIDRLCAFEPQFRIRVCRLTFDLKVPFSMSVQGSSVASFKIIGANSTVDQDDESTFVIPPAPLPSSPQQLARLYHAPLQYTVLHPSSSYAIFSSSEVVLQDDLDAYGKWMGLSIGNFSFDNLPYEKCPNCIRTEATLDSDIMLGMIKGATAWHWNFDVDSFFFFLTYALLDNVNGTPDVISVSYGVDEIDSIPLRIVYEQFAMLATTSKTILTASGDNGVFGNGCICGNFNSSSQCSLCCGRSLSKPEWPATSPYVVAVGGTSAVVSGSTPFYQNPSAQQNTNFHDYVHEIMAGSESGGLITSGGGYSSLFAAQSYQRKPIQCYLAQQSNDTNQREATIAQTLIWPAHNGSGTLMRGYPDVSMLAVRIPVVETGTPVPLGRYSTAGTSGSTPMFASYVVMINDMRLQAGLPKLGNMLPLLYMLGEKHPEVYNDVTVGYHGYSMPHNNGCQGYCTQAIDCIINNERQGLTAAPGWDAVTGFGSIHFERFIRFALPGTDVVASTVASATASGAAQPSPAQMQQSTDEAAERTAALSQNLACDMLLTLPAFVAACLCASHVCAERCELMSSFADVAIAFSGVAFFSTAYLVWKVLKPDFGFGSQHSDRCFANILIAQMRMQLKARSPMTGKIAAGSARLRYDET